MMAPDMPGAAPVPRGREAAVTHFMAPSKSFGALDAKAIAALVAASGDVALVLDPDGTIQDIAYGSPELMQEWGNQWLGRAWADTVTVESRPKVEALLRDAVSESPRWRHVNHAAAHEADIPVQYTAVQVGPDGMIVAVGRDLRGISALQQRLVAAQQAVERDYARLRQMELRYRLLFQATPDPVLIVDAASLKVAEANPAAIGLLSGAMDPVVGRSLLEGFDAAGAEALQALLAHVRATGRAEEAVARAALGEQEFRVSASLFRHEGTALFLVRLSGREAQAIARPAKGSALLPLLERMPDGFVATDAEGRILEANPAFLDLAQLATAEQARGESLERWLGRPGVDLNVLVANLRQHGAVRLYATTLRGEYGGSVDIEVSAASLPDGDRPGFGFTIRNVGRRLAPEGRKAELPRSVQQLKELVGRVPLKDLVRETTDVVEQLCIEAALELTGDNRASAAEILGLSRQSLYVKLRRYGLGDSDGEGE